MTDNLVYDLSSYNDEFGEINHCKSTFLKNLKEKYRTFSKFSRCLIYGSGIILSIMIILLIIAIILSIYSGVAYGACVLLIKPVSMTIITCTIVNTIAYIMLTFLIFSITLLTVVRAH